MRDRCNTWLLRCAVGALAIVGLSCRDGAAQRDGAIPARTTVSVATETAAAPLPDLLDAFARHPLSDLAQALPDAMAATRDSRWVPYLIDLVRVAPSTIAQERALDALRVLTGLTDAGPLGTAYLRYGGWAIDNRIDPGAEYPSFKTALYAQLDPDFEPLLAGVTDRVVLAGLQWGGVPLGGIPELNAPPRVEAAGREWAESDEPVIHVVVDGDEVGYPFRIIGRHELSNDVIGDRPVVVSFCTLCRTATVFERTVGGVVLDFQTSGLLLNSNKVMVDRQTSSLWQQLTGEAIAGPLAGTRLVAHGVETMTWADWRREHPVAPVLDLPVPWEAETDVGRVRISYEYSPGAVQPGYYATAPLWYPVLSTPPVFPLKAEVATISVGGAHLAVERGALARHGPVVLPVGPAFVVVEPTNAGARFYDAAGLGLGAGAPVEREVLAHLPRLSGGQSFWFAWYGVHPDTAWWPDR